MNIFVNSLPKSGTNLVQKALKLANIRYSGKSIAASSLIGKNELIKQIVRHPGVYEVPVPIGLEVPVNLSPKWLHRYLKKADGYVSGHSAYTDHFYSILEQENYKVIQVIRHPGGVVASWANYIIEPGYYWTSASVAMKRMTFNERVQKIITGGYLNENYYSNFRDILKRISGWFEGGTALIIRFEDLVGSQGGGNAALQRDTIRCLLEYIGTETSSELIEDIAQNLYGGTLTFREGKIDSWKDALSPESKLLISELIKTTSFLEDLKYLDL